MRLNKISITSWYVIVPIYLAMTLMTFVLTVIAFMAKQSGGGYPSDGDSIGIPIIGSFFGMLIGIVYFLIFYVGNLTKKMREKLSWGQSLIRVAVYILPPLLLSILFCFDIFNQYFYLVSVMNVVWVIFWVVIGIFTVKWQSRIIAGDNS